MNTTRRTFVITAIAACVLTACGSSAAAPTTCPTDEILPTMNRYIEGSVFIDTAWEPMPNISINATFLRDLSQAQPLVDAAIQVVR